MSEKEASGSPIEQLLFEIATYLRASAASVLKEKASQAIDTYRKAITYKNLDGYTNQAKIANTLGVTRQSISNYVQDFVEAGLAMQPSKFYSNNKALFTLEELGIDINKLKKQERAKGKKKTITQQEATEEE